MNDIVEIWYYDNNKLCSQKVERSFFYYYMKTFTSVDQTVGVIRQLPILSNCCVALKYIDLLNDSCSFLFNKTSKYKHFIMGELEHLKNKEK